MHVGMFTGQGAQFVGMGAEFAASFPVARDTFQQADAILGIGLSALCFDGPAARLNATDIQQPAIFTTSVAIYRAALDSGLLQKDQFAAVGGLSLGEYTALHIAGVLSFEDGLRLVQRRGQLMQQVCVASPGGMVTLLGMDEPSVLALCERVADQGRVAPANFNCPGQTVISGVQAACDATVALAGEFNGRAIPLDVAGAFHSELMKPAADRLRETLDATEFSTPHCRVIANVDAEYHTDASAMRDRLHAQVYNPVRWQACVERLIADGGEHFWEFGPGRILTGLMRKINRKIKTTNLGKASDLQPTQVGADA